jgi:hypothetical protein
MDFINCELPTPSIPTGKSGGFRVITYYQVDTIIYLVTIYAKSDKDSISIKALQEIIKSEL